MSKIFGKWFGGGGRKGKRDLCSEPCCVEKRQKEKNDDSLSGKSKVENMSAHLESQNNINGNGHIKTDQSDGKKFSKIIQTTKSNRCCGRDNVSDSSNDSLTGSPSDTGGHLNNANVDELMGYYEPRTKNLSWMPVSKDASHYNMDHFRRGKALIFNFDTWDNTTVPSLDLKPRLGSQKDRDDLAACLKNLDFDVKIHNNLKSGQFWKVIRETRKDDHRENDCLVVAIMTHGEKNHIFLRDGTLIPVNLVWEKFEAHKCPSLAGKPKIFLIQACRGTNYDHGTTLSGSQDTVTAEIPRDVTDSSNFSYVIPNAADIIVAFSCPEGHYSWRHPTEGSWFIQAICKVLNEHAYDMDLQGCLTKVAREVALYKESFTTNPANDKKRQVTATSSTLIRTVQFKPKKPFYITTPHSILVTSTEKAVISVGKGGGGDTIEPLPNDPLDFIPPLVAASPNGASFNEVFDSKL